MTFKHSSNKGIALISVLIVIAILTPLMVGVIERNQSLYKKIISTEGYSSSLTYIMFAEDFVRYQLNEDRKSSRSDHAKEKWNNRLENIPVDGGFISGHIIELQGKLNLNNLYLPKSASKAQKEFEKSFQVVLRRLFINLGMTQVEANIITNAIKDWVDIDSNMHVNGGAEDSYYETLSPAYRTANGPMGDLSELRMIKGIDDKIFKLIAPCLAALPAYGTKVNINMASEAVRAAIAPKLKKNIKLDCDNFGETTANSIASFVNANDMPKNPNKKIDRNLIGVISNYFVVNISAVFGASRTSLHTYLHRHQKSVKVLYRNFGDSIMSAVSSSQKNSKDKLKL